MDEQPATPPTNSTQPAAPAKEAAVSGAPSTWPGAFGAYKYSKPAVRLNLVTLIVLWILAGIFGSASKNAGGTVMASLDILSLIVGSLASAAYTLTFIAGVRGNKLSIGESLSQGVTFWLRSIGLSLLIAVSLILSLVLFIIPFFFVLPRLILAEYYLVDKNLSVMDAYKASWEATKGNAGKVWGIFGASIAMGLLAFTIIGIPFAIYFLIMYSAVFGVFYKFLNKSPAAAAAPVAAPTPRPAA